MPSRTKKKVVRRFNAHVVQLKPFRARSDEWHVSEIDEPTGSENDIENRTEAEVTQVAVVPVMEDIPAQQLPVPEVPIHPPVRTRSGRISRLPTFFEDFDLN